MSGGAYQYAYSCVADVADEICRRHATSALHLAFAAHLRMVARAMRDIEWEDSGDGAPSVEASIRLVLAPGAELDAAVAVAREAQQQLAATLARVEGGA